MRSSSKALAAALLAASAASAGAKLMEDVVASVNGKPLLLSEYKKNVSAVVENFRQSMPDLTKDDKAMAEIRDKVLQQMVDDEVLAQEAETLKVKVHTRELDKGVEEVSERSFRLDESSRRRRSDEEMRAALLSELQKEGLSEEQFRERIRRQLMIRKVVEERVRPEVKPAEEKRVKAAFDRIKAVVSGDTTTVRGLPEEEAQAYVALGSRLAERHAESVRVQHIFVKTGPSAPLVEKNKALQRAQALKKRLDAGEDFSDLAAKESDDSESAPRGGELGVLLRGMMPESFENAAFSIGVGETSAPVETPFGFHLIRVQEKRAKQPLNYEKLKDDLASFLYQLDFQARLQDLVKKLRAKSTIEIQKT